MAKPKYDKWLQKENLLLLEGWRRDGLDLAQIAHNMGINRTTLYKWCNDHSDIDNALKKGAEVSCYEIENAMYKSAIGHYVEEQEMIETSDEITGQKVITKKVHRRYVPPNVTAQIFILKNRRSDFWRDSKQIETKNDGQLAALIDGLKEPEEKKDEEENKEE